MKLNYKQTFFVGLAFMSICMFWGLYDNVIPLILKNTFGLKETLIGAIMAIDNVLAVFMLPIFGSISDKTKSKMGRRTPYIIFGTLGAVIVMQFIAIANNLKSIALFMIALIIVLNVMAVYRSPAVALMPDVTPKPFRSRGNAVINLMGSAGTIITLGLTLFLLPKGADTNYIPVFLATGVAMLVAIIVHKIFVNEPKISLYYEKETVIDEKNKNKDKDNSEEKMSKDVKRSLIFLLISVLLWFMAFNAVTTAFSRYAQEVWKIAGGGFASALMISQVSAIVCFLPIGFLSSKWGRKRTILIGIALLALSFGAAALIKTYNGLVYLFFVTAGMGWAAINVNSYPMVVEMGKGSDVGKYTGYYYTFSMLAQIITPILSGYFIEHIGYRTLFPYSFIFCVLAFVTMQFVKHGNAKNEKLNP